MTSRERIAQLVKALPEVYPDAHCELNFRNPLELLVATVLSAQCTDKRVNLVTADLFKRLKNAADYASIPQEQLETAIKSTGFFRNKAKSIRGMAARLIEAYGGKVPETMEELTSLPGVGRKTANVVLGNAFASNVGVVVDTHVARLSHRRLTRVTLRERRHHVAEVFPKLDPFVDRVIGVAIEVEAVKLVAADKCLAHHRDAEIAIRIPPFL